MELVCDYPLPYDLATGLCVRSVCWEGEKVLAGTKDSEVFEIELQSQDNPRVIVQVRYQSDEWRLQGVKI